jgi:hypothetical protein
LPRNLPFAMRPCAYCGKVTGRNQAEHVVPKCLYTAHIPARVQRLTVPACNECNLGFSFSEAHFRNIVAASGLEPSPQRRELLESVLRSLREPKSGRRDLQRLWQQMIDAPVLKADGTPYKQVVPHADEEVRFIARKVVRGLVHSLSWHTVISNECVIVREYVEPPEEVAEVMEEGYCVPGHFSSKYVLIDERFAEEFRRDMHSFWQVRFFDLPLSCLVVRRVATTTSGKTSTQVLAGPFSGRSCAGP